MGNINLSGKQEDADNKAALDTSTLAGQTGNLHDRLFELEGAVGLLENALEPVLNPCQEPNCQEGNDIELLPPAVESVRHASFRVHSLRLRINELRQRLALQ